MSVDAERELLDRRQREFLTALATKDHRVAAQFFADDATLHIANMPAVQGRSEIVRFYANLFRFLEASAVTPETMHMSDSGDLAYSIGRASNTFRGAQRLTEYSGKYLLVWRKHEGRWAIAAYSVSSDQSDAAR